MRNFSRYFGSVIALNDVSISVYSGEVMCLLGDNGAGKSTLIKILSGVHQPSEGEYLVEGKIRAICFTPGRACGRHRDGLSGSGHDSADEYFAQFLSRSEPTMDGGHGGDSISGRRPDHPRRACEDGHPDSDTEQAVGTLSGGERQSVAIARAVYFGAKVLILDEPTAALGVKEAGVVLRYIAQAGPADSAWSSSPTTSITLSDRRSLYVPQSRIFLRDVQQIGRYAGRGCVDDGRGEELDELAHELEEFARADRLSAPSTPQ